MEAADSEGDQVTRCACECHEVESLDFAHDQLELHKAKAEHATLPKGAPLSLGCVQRMNDHFWILR